MCVLFDFQSSITYEITGLSNAPDYFSIGENDGQIKVKSDLTQDPVKQAMYRVRRTNNTMYTLYTNTIDMHAVIFSIKTYDERIL